MINEKVFLGSPKAKMCSFAIKWEPISAAFPERVFFHFRTGLMPFRMAISAQKMDFAENKSIPTQPCSLWGPFVGNMAASSYYLYSFSQALFCSRRKEQEDRGGKEVSPHLLEHPFCSLLSLAFSQCLHSIEETDSQNWVG